MITKGHPFTLPRSINSHGLTVVGLVIFLLFLGVVCICGLWVLGVGKKGAYEIAAKHDLFEFVEAQQAYYAKYGLYNGDVDDVISNDPRELSTFTLEGFSPSEGVVIKVISREPFIIVSKHYDVDVGFQYNFELGVIKKIGGQNAEHTQ